MQKKFRYRLVLIALLLLGAGLRFGGLNAQSFWSDEGNSARLVERALPLIVEGAAGDIHPPGYYLLLHAWWRIAGGSEVALRSFSAFCGVLTVALAAALGQRLGGRVSKAIAALLAALHPLAVYYSQEARMYALLGLVAAMTLLLAYRVVRTRGAPRAGLALTLSLVLGLYTHYAYAFVLPAINLPFLVCWLAQRRRRRWHTLGVWVAAHGLAGLAFLPWLPNVRKLTSWSPPDLNTGHALIEMGRTLLTGVTLPGEALSVTLPVVASALLLLALLRPSRTPFLKWGAVTLVVLPPALIVGLGVYREAYLKFLMVSSAPLTALVALTWRPVDPRERELLRYLPGLGALLTVLLLPAQARALHHLYTNSTYTRDDYRRIAAEIAAAAEPGDAVFLSAPNQWEVFTYYYRGPLPVYPAIYHPTPEEADVWINELRAKNHRQLFVLYWGERESDPHARLERRLATDAYKADERWVTRVRVARYGMAPLPTSPDVRRSLQLGDAIAFEGYSVVGGPFAPGDIVPLTLFWHAPAAPSWQYKVFVHLLNAQGELVSQNDVEPQAGFRPTNRWEAGARIVDRYGVLLPKDLPAGTYTLEAGMYNPQNGTRLPVQEAGEVIGDAIPLGSIEVRE